MFAEQQVQYLKNLRASYQAFVDNSSGQQGGEPLSASAIVSNAGGADDV